MEPVTDLVLNKSTSEWVNEWTNRAAQSEGWEHWWAWALPLKSLLLPGEMEMNPPLQIVVRITQMVKSLPQWLEENKTQYISVNFLFCEDFMVNNGILLKESLFFRDTSLDVPRK